MYETVKPSWVRLADVWPRLIDGEVGLKPATSSHSLQPAVTAATTIETAHTNRRFVNIFVLPYGPEQPQHTLTGPSQPLRCRLDGGWLAVMAARESRSRRR